MKKVIPFLLLAFVIALTGCSQSGNKDKQQDNEQNKQEETDNSENSSSESTKTEESTDKDNDDKEVEKIAQAQMDAKKNAETYVDLTFSYKLGSQYKEYKDIFSKSMYNQLAKNDIKTKEQDDRDKTAKEVNDIKIYFNDDEDIPKKALYTATYKITDHKEKNIIQRNVTGEIDFIEEKGKIKIDGSKIIKTADNDDVNAYE